MRPRYQQLSTILCIVVLTSSCATLPMMGRNETFQKNSSLNWKIVMSKRDPVYLTAPDGTECTVSRKRFDKIKSGDSVLCLWQSSREKF